MKADLLPLLVDPVDHSPLVLKDAVKKGGEIVSGSLVNVRAKRSYPIIAGVPRFVPQEMKKTVHSFGDQWNFFNFDKYFENWRKDIIERSFGSLDFIRGKVVLEAGAGSGMHTKWLAEAGAKKVIALELSHSVDDVMKRNLKGMKNVEVIQCSIDAIPLQDAAVADMVMCVNVIQHTPSVERTARELWRVTAPGGEFDFNCYMRTEDTLLDKARFAFYSGVRAVVSRLPFWARLVHAYVVSALGLVPGVGTVLIKADMLRRGEVAKGKGYWGRLLKSGVLNTFDYYGAHSYQHHYSLKELDQLATKLGKVAPMERLNDKIFLRRPQPAGLLFRLKKVGKKGENK